MDRRAWRDEGDIELYGSVIDIATQEADVEIRIAKVIFVLTTSDPANTVNVRSDSVDNATSRDDR